MLRVINNHQKGELNLAMEVGIMDYAIKLIFGGRELVGALY